MALHDPAAHWLSIDHEAGDAGTALIPVCLVLIRAELAPAIVWLAHFAPRPYLFGLFLVVALFTDLVLGRLDGRLWARSAVLLRMHETVRVVFSLAALYALWLLHPGEVRGGIVAILLLLALAAARRRLELRKFGHVSRYQTWTAEAWALTLGLALLCALGCGADAAIVTAALGVGIAVQCEKLMISLVLTRSQTGVTSILHALRITS